MEPAAGDRVAVDDAGREEGRRAHEQEPRREDHRPVGEAALHDRAGMPVRMGTSAGSPARVRRRYH